MVVEGGTAATISPAGLVRCGARFIKVGSPLRAFHFRDGGAVDSDGSHDIFGQTLSLRAFHKCLNSSAECERLES